jgi:ABC-type iron transport system FetAB permease component
MEYLRTIAQDVRLDHWSIAYLVLMFPVIISLSYRLKLHGELLQVSIRATLQLVFIALVLLPVFSSHWSVQALLVTAMIVMGALIARERGKKLPQAFITSLFSIIVSIGVIMPVFVLTGALAGMMIAGASPLEAAGYQILIFFGIISSASLSAIITNHRVYRQLFRRNYPHLIW